MAISATPGDRELTLAPLVEKVDHGARAGHLIIEYSTGRKRSKTATCADTPPSSASTWRRSTGTGSAVAERIRRDTRSGLASSQVLGTPTLFIDGFVHRGGYDPPALLAPLGR